MKVLSFSQFKFWLISLGILLLSFLFQLGTHRFSGNITPTVEAPPVFLGTQVNPKIITRLLGSRLLVADMIWIDLLLKADHRHEGKPFTSMYEAAKTMLILDPTNYYAYYLVGLYLSVIKDDIKGATDILREGAKQLELNKGAYTRPEAWKVFFMLGYNLIFEEMETEEGSIWVQKAAALPQSPKYVKDLGKKVSTTHGKYEVASHVLADFYRKLEDPEQKKIVEEKMLNLALRQELIDLNEKFSTFLSTTEAYALPKKKAFQLFFRSIGRPRKDLLGRPLGLDSLGKIAPMKSD